MELLARQYPDGHRPAISTIHAVLDRRGLVKHRKGRKNKAAGTVLTNSERPNDLRYADHKGELMLTDQRYCYLLTVTDYANRCLFAVEALQSTNKVTAFTLLERVFRENGMPSAIRTDNAVPFASPNAQFNVLVASVVARSGGAFCGLGVRRCACDRFG
jgi:putative transposase